MVTLTYTIVFQNNDVTWPAMLSKLPNGPLGGSVSSWGYPHSWMVYNGKYHLVGGWAAPLINIRQLGLLFPIYGKMFQTTNQFNLVMFHSYSYQKVSRLVNVPYMEHTYIYTYHWDHWTWGYVWLHLAHWELSSHWLRSYYNQDVEFHSLLLSSHVATSGLIHT